MHRLASQIKRPSAPTRKASYFSLTRFIRALFISMLCLNFYSFTHAHTVKTRQDAVKDDNTTEQRKALTIAVAANFHNTLKKLTDVYPGPQKFVLVTASSGQLYHQITQGAPYDVFFSATPDYINALQNANLVATDFAPLQFAIGRLALWAPSADNPKQIRQWLQNPAKRNVKLALANPELAPFGRAALQTLKHLGLEKTWKGRIVRAMNANQTYHFVFSRTVMMGFTSLAHLKQKNISPQQYWIVPDNHHAPIRQQGVILKRSQSSSAAQQFLAYLTETNSKRIITNAGYQLSNTSPRLTPSHDH